MTPIIGDEHWAAALAEYENTNRRPGLYARVFSEAQGNEAVAKANYLKHRAAELAYEHRQQVLAQAQAQARAEREAVMNAALAKLTEEQRAYELLPKGKCPNCNAVIPLASERCPKCIAIFTADDGWKIIPLQEAEEQAEILRLAKFAVGLADPRLVLAVSSGNLEAVYKLLQDGVKPIGTDRDGASLVDLARKKEDQGMIGLLESRGAI